MASDLVAFLTARIGEDEQRARAALEAWEDEDSHYEWQDLPDEVFAHARWHDPARVLREVEAKRTILVEHSLTHEVIPPSYQAGTGLDFGCENCHDWDGVTEGRGYCGTLRALAAIYSDHPDYRQEWKP